VLGVDIAVFPVMHNFIFYVLDCYFISFIEVCALNAAINISLGSMHAHALGGWGMVPSYSLLVNNGDAIFLYTLQYLCFLLIVA
jgi:hypothetical protein